MQNNVHHAAHRHECIADIIRGHSVGSQAELAELLAQRGIRVSQSCLSRDLSLLGAVKRDRSYTLVQPGIAEDDRKVLEAYARSVDQAGPHLAIMHTATGAAQRVALFLDRSGWPEVLATLAGDDTIFVATRNHAEQRILLSRLRRAMG